MFYSRSAALCALLVLLALLGACGQGPAATSTAAKKLKVVASTSLVGDVVQSVGGELIELSVLMPPGSDPHSFEFTPQDVAQVAEADVVFINGVGLEAFMVPLIESVGGDVNVVEVSKGIVLIPFEGEHAGEVHTEGEGHAESGDDPHVWWNPLNVAVWVENISARLGELDSANAATYSANAKAYSAELTELDEWIAQQVARIPAANRKLVTDHGTFGYLAQRYGFEQLGAVIPASSTMAEPSAQELAALEEALVSYKVPAIFVGSTVNPTLAQRVAEDTGTQLVVVHTDALGEPGSPAATYLTMVRSTVQTIVDALQ